MFGKLNASNIAQYTAFLLFITVSMLVSTNFIISFSTVWYEQAVLFVVSLGLELFKIYCLIQAYLLWEEKGKWNEFFTGKFNHNKFFKASRKFLMYGILAGIAIFSSYAYSLSLINAQAQIISATVGTSLVDTAEKKYNDSNKQLTVLITEQDSLPSEHSRKLNENGQQASDLKEKKLKETVDWKIAQIEKDITALQKERKAIDSQFEKDKAQYKEDIKAKTLEVNNLKDDWDNQRGKSALKQEQIKDPSNQISVISEKLGMGKETLIMLVMMFVSIMVEAGIVSTAPHALHKTEPKNDNIKIEENIVNSKTLPVVKRTRRKKDNSGNATNKIVPVDESKNENVVRSTDPEANNDRVVVATEDVELKHEEIASVDAIRVGRETNEIQQDTTTKATDNINNVVQKEPNSELRTEPEILQGQTNSIDKDVLKKYIFGIHTVEFKDKFINFVNQLFQRSSTGNILPNALEEIIANGSFTEKEVSKYFKILEKITGVTGQHIITGSKINYNRSYIINYLSMEIE
jgi:hypothetical protein